MTKPHLYRATLVWSAPGGVGTTSYRAYSRDHSLGFAGKPELAASADPAFRGDPARYNPEELLVAALSSCHMLWYLHLCARDGIVVVHYTDEAEGTMIEDKATGGHFERVVLRPRIRITSGDARKAADLHQEAHRLCFVSNSVNFPVDCQPEIEIV